MTENTKRRKRREELESMEKSEMVEKMLKLEAQNVQLRQIIIKLTGGKDSKTKNGAQKTCDFSKYQKRHIFLKFYYLGWDYHGFVSQEDTMNTIEHHLFSSLIKSCLIENRETSNYHRCGRTDKGVSAFSQVISIDVRSCLEPEMQQNLDKELNYCKILNRILPRNVRCYAWSPAENSMSARFDCTHRTYKYFFPRADLDVQLMNEAAKLLIGNHDFRNLCKMDVGNGVVSFLRTISDAKVEVIDEKNRESSGYNMCEFTIKSQAFLWHQIRCIMGILFFVGRKHEKPEIVGELLDVEKFPRKPQYSLANEVPLNLFHCEYENANWYIDRENLCSVIRDLQEDWTLNSVKSTMTKCILDKLMEHFEGKEDLRFQDEVLFPNKSKVYQPLTKRLTCASLENRIKHFTKKRRIEPVGNSTTETSSGKIDAN